MDNNKSMVKFTFLPIASMQDLATAGNMLAASGMFGINSPAAGFVVAATCHAEGISFLEFQRTYHIIENKPAMRADAMLAKFRERGGRYIIIENSKEKASADFEFEKSKINFTYSMEDAKQAGICYGSGGKLKTNWEKFPSNMLWARMASNAVRRLCPEIVAGTYTPEEIEDFDDTPRSQAEEPQPITTNEMDDRIAAMKSAAPEPEPEPEFDYSICPIPGGMFQKPWALMDLKTLRLAYTLKHEKMEPKHYEMIKNLVIKLEQERGSGNGNGAN